MRISCGVRMIVPLVVLVATTTAEAQTRPILFPSTNPDRSTRPTDPDRPSADEVSGLKTSVEFQILSGNPSIALDSHRWVEALQKHGVTVRVRTPKAGDELGVTERVQGTLRWVVATGEITERGVLRFPQRSLRLSDTVQVKEWIDELKLYGAQGAPEGKPLWGLTYPQFDKVFAALSMPVENPIQGLPLDAALQQLQLPKEMPLRYHSSAIKLLDEQPAAGPVRPEVQGVANGTALAAVLANYGLGYRPLRTPAGSLELVIEPLANLKQPWPIGWETGKEFSRGKSAPELFKMAQVGFDEVPLEKILAAVADVAQIPVVINYYSAGQRGIDLATPVSYPKKRAAYMMVLSSVVRTTRMKQEFRIDERGAPFIYVTAFVPQTIKDLSPAESR